MPTTRRSPRRETLRLYHRLPYLHSVRKKRKDPDQEKINLIRLQVTVKGNFVFVSRPIHSFRPEGLPVKTLGGWCPERIFPSLFPNISTTEIVTPQQCYSSGTPTLTPLRTITPSLTVNVSNSSFFPFSLTPSVSLGLWVCTCPQYPTRLPVPRRFHCELGVLSLSGVLVWVSGCRLSPRLSALVSSPHSPGHTLPLRRRTVFDPCPLVPSRKVLSHTLDS